MVGWCRRARQRLSAATGFILAVVIILSGQAPCSDTLTGQLIINTGTKIFPDGIPDQDEGDRELRIVTLKLDDLMRGRRCARTSQSR